MNTVLDYMIKMDLQDKKEYIISHHLLKNPTKIEVKPDEIIYIDNIDITPSGANFSLEFYSASESREIDNENSKQVNRHKGHVYFKNNNISDFAISFVKLKLFKK